MSNETSLLERIFDGLDRLRQDVITMMARLESHEGLVQRQDQRLERLEKRTLELTDGIMEARESSRRAMETANEAKRVAGSTAHENKTVHEAVMKNIAALGRRLDDQDTQIAAVRRENEDQTAILGEMREEQRDAAKRAKWQADESAKRDALIELRWKRAPFVFTVLMAMIGAIWWAIGNVQIRGTAPPRPAETTAPR